MARSDREGVRLRIHIEPRHGGTYADFRALALAVEEAGFDAFFRSDHLLGVVADDPSYQPTDCWTTLGALARDTKRVRLGALMGAATYRYPGLLATILATVDQASGGRVELGLGTGWYEREHAAFGIPFPATKERFDRLEEQLAVITGLWTAKPGEPFSFEGAHYRIEKNYSPPRVVQSPHPPILVGGTGLKRTPAIAARYATEYNLALGGDMRVQLDTFTRACEAIGRDPAEPRRSAFVPAAVGTTAADVERRVAAMGSPFIQSHAASGPPEQLVERIGELAGLGIDTVYLAVYDIHDLDHIALIGAEVLPHVKAMKVAAP